MNLLHKTFEAANVKVLSADEGIIEAVVSVFGNTDSARERVMPGFFKDSISRKLPKGVWSHDWTLPVAKTLEAEELLPGDGRLPDTIRNNGGLYIKGQFNLDTQRGREAFSDIKFGTIDEFSFGYTVEEDSKDKDSGVRDLLKGTIYEWSPVLVGCNSATALLSAKAAEPAGTEFKAQYLGDYVEGAMTMAALSRLNDALFYNVLYDVLFDDDTPLSERLEMLRAAFDEFRDIALRTVESILSSSEDGATEIAAKEIKTFYNDPQTKDALPAGVPFATHLDSVLAAVVGATGRAKSLHELRTKEGRTLSAANREKLTNLLTALKEAESPLEELLSATEPKSAPVTASEAKATLAQVYRRRASSRALLITP